MRIIAISPRIPEEGQKGDQVLSFYRLCYLARNHQIKLICFGDAEKNFEAKLKLESVGISVELIRWSKFFAALNILRYALDAHTPFQCALFESNEFKKTIHVALVEFSPDAIYAVTIRAMGNIRSYSGPLFVDLVDSLALNFSRRVDMANGVKRILLNLEYERVKGFEKKVAQRADRSFVVSSIDQKMIGNDKVGVIPLGIDSLQFYKSAGGCTDPVVVFTGNMNYKPNVDAALWFYRHCWGKLKDALPEVRLVIAGSNPTDEIIALRSDNAVTITGRVPSLATVINSARVSIAPMQSGSGMQFKILEAMACAVPVVSTKLGLGDIGAKVGRDILLADTPESFVEAIISILQSEELRTKIGNSGYKYVNEHHTWDVLNADFEASIIATFS